MSDKPNNPNAYPEVFRTFDHDNSKWIEQHKPGMTLRDYFAAKALQGFAANAKWAKSIRSPDDWDDYIARLTSGAFEVSDLMLKAREK